MDAETLRQNCLDYIDTFKESHDNAVVAYASKSLLTVGIAQFMAKLGMGFDVCSGGEIYTILKAGVDCNTVYFHGNNKSLEELALAIKHGIRIVVDNEQELNYIKDLCGTDQKAKILIRLKPEIEAHTHEYIKTGQIDSKFGISKLDLIPTVQSVLKQPCFEFLGIHAHIGSQIFDEDPFYDLITIMVGHVEKIYNECGVIVQELDLGGGFGIQYIDSDDPPNVRHLLKKMIVDLQTALTVKQLQMPKIIVSQVVPLQLLREQPCIPLEL